EGEPLAPLDAAAAGDFEKAAAGQGRPGPAGDHRPCWTDCWQRAHEGGRPWGGEGAKEGGPAGNRRAVLCGEPAAVTGRRDCHGEDRAGRRLRPVWHGGGLLLMILLVVVVLLVIALVVAYTLLEKRSGYGAYYGLAKFTGSRLDIGPVDWAKLTRHATPNDALICPAGRCPNAKSDGQPKTYPVPPAELLARLRKTALAEPNTRELSGAPDNGARFLQHTRLMRFPDTVDVEIFPIGRGHKLRVYSRSLIGRKDFGVNRARVERWLAALD